MNIRNIAFLIISLEEHKATFEEIGKRKIILRQYYKFEVFVIVANKHLKPWFLDNQLRRAQSDIYRNGYVEDCIAANLDIHKNTH